MQVLIERTIAFFTALITLIAGWFGINYESGKRVSNFRVVSYIRGDYVQTPDSLYFEDFDIITDVILFECASFNSDGRHATFEGTQERVNKIDFDGTPSEK